MPNKRDYTNGLPDPSALRDEILKKYPAKIAKKRIKGIVINDPNEEQEVMANVRTIPGIISQRGCTYAGCKGVVLGPTRDIINLVHGPIGCSFYAWLTRRNQTRALEGDENFSITKRSFGFGTSSFHNGSYCKVFVFVFNNHH